MTTHIWNLDLNEQAALRDKLADAIETHRTVRLAADEGTVKIKIGESTWSAALGTLENVVDTTATTTATADEDDEPQPDVEFDLTAVVTRLQERGIPAYVEQTGGGCATIYAGGQHVYRDGQYRENRWDVAAGPGDFDWGGSNHTGLLAEFSTGPNDDGESDSVSLPDTITKAADAVAWAVDAIAEQVAATANRTHAEWNRRPCRHCGVKVTPAADGSWVDDTNGDGCKATGGYHETW